MKRLVSILLIASSLLLASGCTTTNSGQPSPFAKVAVQYAVAKVLEKNPGSAARVVEISAAVRATASGDASITVQLLDTFIRSRIDWTKLNSPADRVLVNALLDTIKAELTARIGGGTLPADRLVVVAEVAGWIEDIAKASLPSE